MSCIAVPIRDPQGRVFASLSATGHAENMIEQRRAELLPALIASAAEITRKMYPAGGAFTAFRGSRPGRSQAV
jgi:DNA-binding IclR family transcriptional regulator